MSRLPFPSARRSRRYTRPAATLASVIVKADCATITSNMYTPCKRQACVRVRAGSGCAGLRRHWQGGNHRPQNFPPVARTTTSRGGAIVTHARVGRHDHVQLVLKIRVLCVGERDFAQVGAHTKDADCVPRGRRAPAPVHCRVGAVSSGCCERRRIESGRGRAHGGAWHTSPYHDVVELALLARLTPLTSSCWRFIVEVPRAPQWKAASPLSSTTVSPAAQEMLPTLAGAPLTRRVTGAVAARPAKADATSTRIPRWPIPKWAWRRLPGSSAHVQCRIEQRRVRGPVDARRYGSQV